MNDERIKVGDHVRIVNLLANHKMPVGIVESINGYYIYVYTPVSDETEFNRYIYEAYENELVKITKQEYFKLILSGVNT